MERPYLLCIEIEVIDFVLSVCICNKINARSKWSPCFPISHSRHALDLLLFCPVGTHSPYVIVSREVNILPVRRLHWPPRRIRRELYRVAVASPRRHLPDGGMARICAIQKVDPVAIVRPARLRIPVHVQT